MVKRKHIVAVVINTPTASGSPADTAAGTQTHRPSTLTERGLPLSRAASSFPRLADPVAFDHVFSLLSHLCRCWVKPSPSLVTTWAQRRGLPQHMRSQERTRASHSDFNLIATFWHLKSILSVVFFCKRKDTLRPSSTASEHISRSLPRLEAGLSKVLKVFEIFLGTSHAAHCLHSQAYWRFQRS